MLTVVVIWDEQSFVVNIKEDQWVHRAKFEIVRELKTWYPRVAATALLQVNDIVFEGLDEQRYLAFPPMFIADQGFVLRCRVVVGRKTPHSFYDKAVCEFE